LRPRMLTLAAFLVAVVSLTACSATVGGSGSTETPAASPGQRGAGSGQESSSEVLASFPIPPGATVVARNREGDGVNIVLASVTAENATTFYRQALPGAGYSIPPDPELVAGGTAGTGIEFEGPGYAGSIGGAAPGLGGQTTIGITMIRQ
jgi:hypothetical protein